MIKSDIIQSAIIIFCIIKEKVLLSLSFELLPQIKFPHQKLNIHETGIIKFSLSKQSHDFSHAAFLFSIHSFVC
jgi:hypothetical protein